MPYIYRRMTALSRLMASKRPRRDSIVCATVVRRRLMRIHERDAFGGFLMIASFIWHVMLL